MSTAITTKVDFSNDQLEVIRNTVAKGCTNDELRLFIYQCQRTGLDPLAKQIYAIKMGKDDKAKMVIQTGIDGFRVVAERTGLYKGQVGPMWCGKDEVWKDVWISKDPPLAAKVGILRAGFDAPVWGIARTDAYRQQQNPLWQSMPDVMIAKCAEALGLRRAFPNDLSGLYTKDEMEQAATREVQEVLVVENAVETTEMLMDTLIDACVEADLNSDEVSFLIKTWNCEIISELNREQIQAATRIVRDSGRLAKMRAKMVKESEVETFREKLESDPLGVA